jgi:hypothetical protein
MNHSNYGEPIYIYLHRSPGSKMVYLHTCAPTHPVAFLTTGISFVSLILQFLAQCLNHNK